MTVLGDQLVLPRAGRARLRLLTGTAFVVDAVLIVASIVVATVARGSLTFFVDPTDVTRAVTMVGPALALAWLAISAGLGAYRADLFGSSTEEYKRILNAGLLTAGVLGVGCYLAKLPLSRAYFVLVFLIGVPALLLGRFVLRRLVHRARRHGALLQRVLVVGTVAHIDETTAVLRRATCSGFDVIGALTPAHSVVEETTTGVPVLGNAEDVFAVAADIEVDTILFAGGGLASAQHLREVIWQLEQSAYNVVVAPAVSEISPERISIRPVGGLPLMHIEKPTWANAARWSKRAFDLVGALAILTAAAPVMVFCALRIKRHDGGPVLFRQTRTGRNGEEFSCLKFRTMVVDAEQQLAELHRAAAYDGGLFKMKADPRITRPGRWLRRFSFDELPQLLNVVRGEMSLVGPRPPLPSEVQGYVAQTARRLRVRPGMTGLWQVSGRSDLSLDEAVRLDLYYVDNWSMLQDLSILFRTLGAVVGSRGAY